VDTPFHVLLETLKINADVDMRGRASENPGPALIVQGLAHPRPLLLLPGAPQIARALLRPSRCGMHQVAARCL